MWRAVEKSACTAAFAVLRMEEGFSDYGTLNQEMARVSKGVITLPELADAMTACADGRYVCRKLATVDAFDVHIPCVACLDLAETDYNGVSRIVVVVGLDGGELSVFDPIACGVRTVACEEFLAEFNGWIVARESTMQQWGGAAFAVALLVGLLVGWVRKRRSS